MPAEPPLPPQQTPPPAAPPPAPLAAKAFERLRKLADGNGLAPEALEMIGAEEKLYEIEGILRMEPNIDLRRTRYPGMVRGSDRKVFKSSDELRSEIERRAAILRERPDWIVSAATQAKSQPAEGWGLDQAEIPLPDHSVTLALSETCPACQGRKTLTCDHCQGQGMVTCRQCQGNRREPCPHCMGRGEDPLQPNQQCHMCRGEKLINCRPCNGMGQVNCEICQGQRGVTCSSCNGAGAFTEEVAVTCRVRTYFTVSCEGMPSGLRRGLDRLGYAKLANGYADIETLSSPQLASLEKGKSLAAATKAADGQDAIPVGAREMPRPEIRYRAKMPFAELRARFNGKAAIVSVFGKRGAMLDVPPFLDAALKESCARLKQAAHGEAEIEEALKVRILREALQLEAGGKGTVRELRRIYPVGLSASLAQEILNDMRMAVARTTRRFRVFAAFAYFALCAATFAGLLMTPAHAALTRNLTMLPALLLDLAMVGGAVAAGLLMLNAATRFLLAKRFPELSLALRQKTGKTGMALGLAIFALFWALFFLSPHQPPWTYGLSRHAHSQF